MEFYLPKYMFLSGILLILCISQNRKVLTNDIKSFNPKQSNLVFIPRCNRKSKLYDIQYKSSANKTITSSGNVTCYNSTAEVVTVCQKIFPNKNVSRVLIVDKVLTNEDKVDHLNADIFECLSNYDGTNSARIPALLVPVGCKFKHLYDRDICLAKEEWMKMAFDECTSHNLTLREHAVLDSCQITLFTGIEFVCCETNPIDRKSFNSKEQIDSVGSDFNSVDSFVNPPQPDMIGDLLIVHDSSNKSRWLPYADIYYEGMSLEQGTYDNEEEDDNTFDEEDSSSEDDGDMEYFSAFLPKSQYQIEKVLYKFIYTDLNLLAQKEQEQIVNAVRRLLTASKPRKMENNPYDVIQKSFSYNQANIPTIIRLKNALSKYQDDYLSQHYSQLTILRATKILQRAIDKLSIDIHDGIDLSKTDEENLTMIFLNLLQMLHKRRTLIVILITYLNTSDSHSANEALHLIKDLQNIKYQFLSVMNFINENPTILDNIAFSASTLNQSFSEVSYEADWILQSLQDHNDTDVNSMLLYEEKKKDRFHRVLSGIFGTRNGTSQIFAWTHLPVLLDLCLFGLLLSLLFIFCCRFSSRISNQLCRINDKIKTSWNNRKNIFCRKIKETWRKTHNVDCRCKYKNYQPITNREEI